MLYIRSNCVVAGEETSTVPERIQRHIHKSSFTRIEYLNQITSECLIDSPNWSNSFSTHFEPNTWSSSTNRPKRIVRMVDLGRTEWAKACPRLTWCDWSLTSVSMNILKWSGSQSLFRFMLLIFSSVGYASVLYVRGCSSEAKIFAAVLIMRLISSCPFSCLF